MEKGNLTDIDDYDIDDSFVPKDEINQSLEKILKKGKSLEQLIRFKNYLAKEISQSYEKFVLYVLKDIMLKEMQSGYYQNAANVKEFIDIDNHLQLDSNGKEFNHIENLCIFQNGFYTFNSFNMTISSMSGRRKHSRNNFNEEIFEELRELNIGGKLYEIPLENQGSPSDYADLESKIKVLSREYESYTE